VAVRGSSSSKNLVNQVGEIAKSDLGKSTAISHSSYDHSNTPTKIGMIDLQVSNGKG
jgi:hypothetical protein